MFLHRFPEASVHGINIKQLRGMEGKRVKQTYADLGLQYGVTWKGRDYQTENWQLADGINRALSASNASLYALTAAVCCSMGFIPQLGFVHAAGTLPFIYDAADLYKHETSWPAAFEALSIDPKDDGTLVRKILKQKIEDTRMLRRMPEDLKKLFADLGESPDDAPPDHPLQPKSEA
jgi:CRISPR-associated protein Cas1